MAYDEDLAARIREMVAGTGARADEKQMFGGLAFLVGGNMSVAASGQGGILVRVDPDESDTLLAEPGAGPMEMGGRGAMRGWLRVEAEAVAADDDLRTWVRRGVDYARTLPPKSAGKRK